MHYIVTVIAVIVIVLIGLFLYDRRVLAAHNIIKHRLTRRRMATLAVALIFAILGGVVFAVTQRDANKRPNDTIAVDKVKTAPKVAQTKDLPAYQILTEKNAGSTTLNVVVYTLSTDRAKLTNLNQTLLDKYKKAPITNVYIHYFDDKTVAGNYFDLISKAETSVTLAQKKKLFSHYIAQSYPGITTPGGILFLTDRTEVVKQFSNSTKEPK